MPPSFFTLGQSTVFFSADGYEQYEGHRVFDVARDAKSFIMVRSAPGSPPPRVVLVKHWLAEAKASAANKAP